MTKKPVSDQYAQNPYQSPETRSVPEQPLAARAALTGTMLRYLREASPWLRFIGIMGFIGGGFMVAGGITAAVVTSVVSDLAEELNGFPLGVFGLVYVAIGAVMFVPARFTYLFGAKIRSYRLSNSEQELEQAFKNNKSLWKFFGILCIINLAFVPVGIIGGIAAALGSAFLQ